MAMAVGLQSNNWKGNENFFAYEMHPFYLFNALFALITIQLVIIFLARSCSNPSHDDCNFAKENSEPMTVDL